MEDEKITPQNTLTKIKDLLDSMDVRIDNTSLIQDNKIIYKFQEKLYRCRMPNQRERAEADDFKNKCQIRLMEAGGYKSRKQLRAILKENGMVDLDALEVEKLKLQEDLKQVWMDMAILLDEQSDAIAKIKEKAIDIENKHYDICIEISNYLSPSMEDRIEKEFVEYLTYICTEQIKLDSSDLWEPVWKSYKEFQEDVTHLPNKAVLILTHLLLNTRQ